LIKNICDLHAKISVKDIEFQPSIELRGKRSFGLQDMTKDDFVLLESLNLSLLPVNIRARVADLLWTEKKIYSPANKSQEGEKKILQKREGEKGYKKIEAQQGLNK